MELQVTALDKERYLYEMREKALLDHVSAMDGAKEEGAKEEGRVEGKIEAQRETAQRLLDMGMPIADIAKAIGYQKTMFKNCRATRKPAGLA